MLLPGATRVSMLGDEINNGGSRAAIFDYDGLLVDTELATFEVWRAFYTRNGAELLLADWLKAVGHVDNFDPRRNLENITGLTFDWQYEDQIMDKKLLHAVDGLPPMPGAVDLIQRFRDSGWKIGVASNSGSHWVNRGLENKGIAGMVDAVRTKDDVTRYKPEPDVYLAVLAALDANPTLSIAFEDSGPGVASAKAAGLSVVAVPNALTTHHDLSMATVKISSLSEFNMDAFTGNAKNMRAEPTTEST